MLKGALKPELVEDIKFPLDGDAYPLKWSSSLDTQSLLRMTPPHDYAMYLFSSVKFHLSHRLYLFDEAAFGERVVAFYEDPQSTIEHCQLWYCQFLIILALGKAFLEPTRRHAAPTGFDLFAQAISLLPPVPEMQNDPILAVEVLALVALYMYCVDLRASAYTYVSVVLLS